ncbi:hypothetical protein ACY2I5_005867, partial [Escherichia coli]
PGRVTVFPHLIKRVPGLQPPLINKAHNRASGFFVRTVSSHLFRTEIMVGRTGPTSVGPGSLLTGGCNPVRLATQNCNLWMVSFQNLPTKRPHHGKPQATARPR